VFLEFLRCCYHASKPVYPLLRMRQWTLDEQFTLPLAISQIICQHTPMSPNSICPRDENSTRSIHLMNRVVLVSTDPSWLTLTNDSYHAEVVHDIDFVDASSVCSFQLFNHCGRVMHHWGYGYTHLGSDFSELSVLSHSLLLWYVNEI